MAADSGQGQCTTSSVPAAARSRAAADADELAAEFEPASELLTDALTYCDMTTTPYGEPVDVEKRLSEILSRYGPGAVVTESITEATPHIVGSARRIEAPLVT
jgi:hypothetical protein